MVGVSSLEGSHCTGKPPTEAQGLIRMSCFLFVIILKKVIHTRENLPTALRGGDNEKEVLFLPPSGSSPRGKPS